MTITIEAYSKIAFTSEHKITDTCYDLSHILIKEPTEYNADIKPGCYVMTGDSYKMDYWFGSNDNYEVWRNELCKIANKVDDIIIWKSPDKYKDCPFYELIVSAACDVTIGPKTATKLAADFNTLLKKVMKTYKENQLWLTRYENFLVGFELAADNGVLFMT